MAASQDRAERTPRRPRTLCEPLPIVAASRRRTCDALALARPGGHARILRAGTASAMRIRPSGSAARRSSASGGLALLGGGRSSTSVSELPVPAGGHLPGHRGPGPSHRAAPCPRGVRYQRASPCAGGAPSIEAITSANHSRADVTSARTGELPPVSVSSRASRYASSHPFMSRNGSGGHSCA